MKTTKIMTANRIEEGNTKIEVFGEKTYLTFEATGKGHNVKLSLESADVEKAALAILQASPRFRSHVGQLATALKSADAAVMKAATEAATGEVAGS